MKQSLPAIKEIAAVDCSLLPPDLLGKHLAGLPIAVPAPSLAISHLEDAACQAESAYQNGGILEKSTLEFSSTDAFEPTQSQAFLVTDVQENRYLIGTREKPYPLVEVSRKIDKETNIRSFKVTLSTRKSLIPLS